MNIKANSIHKPLSRRQFMKVAGLGGAAAALSPYLALGGAARAQAQVERPEDFFVKDWRGYQFRPGSPVLSSKWYDHSSYITPIDRFFVRNRYPTPILQAEDWRLTVHGDAVDNPFELSFEELLDMPRRSALHGVPGQRPYSFQRAARG